jgi:DNA-binding NarL/FixJ family response regulator
MNRHQPEPLRAPTPFCMPRSSDLLESRLTATSEAVLHSVGLGRPTNAETEPLINLITSLTPRRFEVLELVARGLTNREIANVLEISANTVKAHLAGILETLELTNRTEAAIALQAYTTETRMTSR